MTPKISEAEAWEPLDSKDWTPSAARHLLRRIAWTATPEQAQSIFKLGPRAACRNLLREPKPMPVPFLIEEARRTRVQLQAQIQEIARDEAGEERRRTLFREIQQAERNAFNDYAVQWLRLASQPETAAQEKLVTFLQNVFVVTRKTVRDSSVLHQHQRILRTGLEQTYPQLCKAVSRSPAMIRFLDLHRSRKGAPNENFARELFELFTLGEGHYSEQDIKESARAFTGYRSNPSGEFVLRRGLHDTDVKTIFGKNGRFDGDEVIDLIFEQPASRTYLPREFLRYYCSEDALPESFVESLGERWARAGFDIQALAEIVFCSRLFYTSEIRENFIKSPLQLLLGLLQDLKLDVIPSPRFTLVALRNMGQEFYNPPNVRGWVGGRLWINSSTLAARRQTIQRVFDPITDGQLNADEYADFMAARVNGYGHFFVEPERLQQLAGMEAESMARHLCSVLLSNEPAPGFIETLSAFLDRGDAPPSLEHLEKAVVALLQSPNYQLT